MVTLFTQNPHRILIKCSQNRKRYVSIDDGNVYLVQNDQMDLYELELKDMIQYDEITEFDKGIKRLLMSHPKRMTERHMSELVIPGSSTRSMEHSLMR